MSRLDHETWLHIHQLALGIHRCDDIDDLHRVLQCSLPALLALPCEVLREPIPPSALPEVQDAHFPFGTFRILLSRRPNPRVRTIISLLLDHCGIAGKRLETTRPIPAVHGQLSARQKEVLQLLLLGQGNSEIAYHLGISVRTVEKHVTAILRAHGAAGRVQLLAVRQACPPSIPPVPRKMNSHCR